LRFNLLVPIDVDLLLPIKSFVILFIQFKSLLLIIIKVEKFQIDSETNGTGTSQLPIINLNIIFS